MRQLSGVDASFLNMEGPTTYGHVSSLNVYDPSQAPGGAGLEATKALLRERLALLGPFRRRLAEVPFGLDLPYWVEDPEFDLDFHVRHHAVPAPGSDEQLAEAVARIVARPLDRARPLWEMYVIEGLPGGRIAQLTKVHHATIDGAAGAQMLMALLDVDPAARPRPPEDRWVPEALPSDAELLGMTVRELLRRPEKLARFNVRLLRALADGTRSGGVRALADLLAQPLPGTLGDTLRRRLRTGDDLDRPPALPLTVAPRTPWNRSISPHRRFAFTSIPLERAKQVRAAVGCTFNDVVMAICSGALRRYLAGHDALPDAPLVAMVPVSIRTGTESDTYENRVSAMFANLATDVADPRARLETIRGAMTAAKDMHAAIPAEVLLDITRFAPPALAARAMRLYSRTRIADRLNPPFNLVISNVPGPSMPLYCAGARLEHFYPVSTVADGQGLNITVQSYCGNLDFGIVVDRDLVPDVWDLAGMLHEATDELLLAVR